MIFRVSIFSKKKKKEFNIYLEHTWRLREQWNRQLENGLNRGSRYDRADEASNEQVRARTTSGSRNDREKERKRESYRASKKRTTDCTDRR